jgi:hypothetical protein
LSLRASTGNGEGAFLEKYARSNADIILILANNMPTQGFLREQYGLTKK